MHGYESIINTDFVPHTISKVEKEINMDQIFINSSESLSGFDYENITRLSYDPLNCFDSHNLNMNKDDEDGGINVNPNEDSQVMQIDVMEEAIMEPFIVGYSEIGDDYMEKHQIYSNKKELQKKLCRIALKRKFQFKTLKSSTKLLHVGCVDKEWKWRLRAIKLGNFDLFQIRKYHSTHTHSLDMISRDYCHASN